MAERPYCSARTCCEEEGKKSNLDQAQIELLEAAARFEMAKKIARKKSG